MPHDQMSPGEHEELRWQVEEMVSKDHVCERISPCAQPHGPLDLMSLYVSGSVPKKVHDFVEGLPYHGDLSDDDLVRNLRTNFINPWGNDEGPRGLIITVARMKMNSQKKTRLVTVCLLMNNRYCDQDKIKGRIIGVGSLSALAFEKQNRRVGSSSSLVITECKKAGKRHLFVNPKDNDDDVAYGDYEAASVYDDEPEYEEEYVSGDVGCDNLIAEEAVQKLVLKTKNHPKPYKLQWLKKGGEVTVSKCVHVAFSVGTTYKDNVWCDVVAMDACHLLLGRPWEYDRDITHNRKTNTYSFLFGCVKVTLIPNKPKEVVNKCTGTLLTLSQFEDELEIMEKINSNAYHLKLPSHIRCSYVFNVKHLLTYHGNSSDEDSAGNSRMNFVYPKGNDVNPSIEERADLFLEAQDRVRKKGFTKVGITWEPRGVKSFISYL
uniref:Reverse transcriptase domain-containing protein n=1 Tax=Tanacetum cinerariifolium TaxID=118510 RepID=A0A6L2JEA8_TANCI|nr:hypothetical protein [Tanacetum cinerariifolium]